VELEMSDRPDLLAALEQQVELVEQEQLEHKEYKEI
jgi:hypothetical protein